MGSRPKQEPGLSRLRPAHGLDAESTWQPSRSAEGGEIERRLVPTLTIVYHPQVERIGGSVALTDLLVGQPVLLSRTAPIFSAGGGGSAGPLADRNLSRNPLRITASGGSFRLDSGDCPTRITVSGRPLKGSLDLPASALEQGIVLEIAGRIVLLLHDAPEGGADPLSGSDPVRAELLGESFRMAQLRSDIRKVADLDVSVLVRGESGSGKELVARALHAAGARRGGPFVAVNLGAIPQALAVSELFGADRGAFTGAVRKQPGYFVQARGGTLFLDEVGEAPPEVQVALLRALETGEIQAVGAQRPEKVDVRVIAATDAHLEVKVASGDFRAPLLYRLSAYELWIPPLRMRRDDIGRLLVHFLAEEIARIGEKDHLGSPPDKGELWLPASLAARLVMYDWPGNVRQLRNVVRQLIIGNRGRARLEAGPELERLFQIGAEPRPTTSLPPPPRTPTVASEPPSSRDLASQDTTSHDGEDEPSARRKPSEVSGDEIEAALRACRWDLTAAAMLLRISRPSLYMLLEGNPRFRTSSELSAEEIKAAHEQHRGDLPRMVDTLQISEKALRRKLRALGM